MSRKTISFSSLFVLAFVALPALAIAVIIGIIGYQMDRVLTKQTGESVQAIATSDGHRLNGEFLAKVDLIRTLARDYASYGQTIDARENQTARLSRAETKAYFMAQNKQWQSGFERTPVGAGILNNAASQHLVGFVAKYPSFKQLMLVDKSGGVVALGGDIPRSIYVADEGWWRRVTDSTYDVEIEAPRLSSNGHEATIELVMPVTSPTVNTPRGYLYAVYRLNDLQMFADSGYATGVGGALSLLDGSGTTIIDTDGLAVGSKLSDAVESALRSKGGPTWYSDVIAGKAMIYSFAKINELENLHTNAISWTLVVRKDKAKALMYLGSLLQLLTLAGLTMVALVIVAGYRLARGFTKPIRQLTQTADALHSGDYRKRAAGSRFVELNTLAETFNAMTESLVRSQADLAASIRGLKQGFIMADKTGAIININQSALSLLGFDQKPAPRTIEEALAGLGGERIIEQFRDFIGGATSKDAGSYIAKDVHYNGGFYNVFFSPIAVDGVLIGAVVQVIDETEQKILQRSRDEFFSIASHELRTPLTAIRGNSDMIKTFYGKKIRSTDFSQMLEDIHSSSVRLIEIVNDFLDASRLEQGKISFNMTTFDIKKVIETVIYENNVVANAKGIHLVFEEKMLGDLPSVRADHDRVKQIVYNLVGNAIKYTQKGSVTIELKATRDTMWMYVHDTGDGISPKSQRLLFHKFQQAKESLYTRDTSRGTGLGLYISRLLADKMGGMVGLKASKEGRGSTFYLRLPLAKED